MSSDEYASEARPGPDGRSNSTFPKEWGRLGPPPKDREERRAWILANIEDGRRRERRGERVDWLAPLERR